MLPPEVLLQWKHAIAGCTAGLTTALTLHPLDVIKTRMQVQDGAAAAVPVYRGTIHAVTNIIQQEGWRALYSGLTPALIGSGMAWGIYFFSYNKAKDRYKKSTGRTNLPPPLHLAAAAEAGTIVCLATNPVWVVKTRLQLQYKDIICAVATPVSKTGALPCGSLYKGFTDCFIQIAKTEGLRGLYKGLLPSLLLVSHGAIQFAVYEELKTFAHSFDGFLSPLDKDATNGITKNNSKESRKATVSKKNETTAGAVQERRKRELTPLEITLCGALSKLTASLATYPSQVIRSRLQQRMEGRAIAYTGVVDVVGKTMRREGMAGFYKGVMPNVLRVMPQSALNFLVYESILNSMNNMSK